jgi:hypothetical protein
MKTLPKFFQTLCALILLIFTNCLILFGLNISPAKEAALETIVNTSGLVAFLIYGAVHTYSKRAFPKPEDTHTY